VTSALQNRLVGTIILVALVVIFLPDFLDGKKESNNQTFASIPANVEVADAVAPKPFPEDKLANATRRPIEIVDEQQVTDSDEAVNQVPRRDPMEQPAESTTQSTSSENPVGNSLQQQTIVKPKPEQATDAGWVVQLGSFRHQKNVQELLDKLENAGYRAFSRKVDTSVGRLNKVFVGPELDRKKLDDALPHLKETTGLTGKVTSFDIATN